MIWLYIYLGISAITFVLFLFTAYEMGREFKRRYPDIEISSGSIIHSIGVTFRTAVMCLIPVVNIGFIWVLLFHDDQVKERGIEKVYAKYLKEKENDQT